jgi:outer membrane protein assembly factor BamB
MSKGVKMPVTKNSTPRLLILFLLLALSLAPVGNVAAAQFPESIPLPNGFQPEGIASGTGTTFYVGSIPTGAVYRGDIETGEGEILVPAQEGRSAIGLKFDSRSGLLYVAGGATGYAYVYDAETGANVDEIQLTTLPSFINDVVITDDAIYFTNSFQPTLYRVSLVGKAQLPDEPVVEEIMLGGEYQFTPGAFNANGITATRNGDRLIIVNSTEGALYNVDPSTGVATRIDLGTGAVPNGDGILLRGRTLYVVQNQLNQVAVIRLNADFTAGTITTVITSPLFRVPTTIAGFGKALYVVNARFGTTPTRDTDYDVVRVPGA